jgi:integrase
MDNLRPLIDKKSLEERYGDYVAEFSLQEKNKGMSRGSCSTHRDMIYTCLYFLGTKRKKVDIRKVTVADLEFIEGKLKEHNAKFPISYVRVFAAFLSETNGEPPLISLGSLGRPVRNKGMLMRNETSVGGGIVTEGGEEDRIRIEGAFKKELDSFSEYEKSLNLAPATRSGHRKRICTCIYLMEKRHGTVDIVSLTNDDLDYIEGRLKDFGVEGYTRYPRTFVAFIHHVTGEPPLRDIGSFGECRPNWQTPYKAGFRFGKELEKYRGLMAKKDVRSETIDINSNRIIVSCNMLDTMFEYRTLGDITVDMLDTLEKELGKRTSPYNATVHIQNLSNFITYFVDVDLYAELKHSRGDHTAFEPKTDSDRRFLDKLNEYREYMVKWEYKPKTIRGRLSSTVRCYKLLKEIKGEYELKDVESYDFRRLRNYMTMYKESTIQDYLFNFGWFLDFATGNNPFELAKMRFNSTTVQRQFIFKNEWMKLYSVDDITERLILSLGATMGLRKKEIIGLKVDDIHETTITIRGKGTGPNGKVETKEMTELIARDLAAYMEYRDRLLDRYGDRSGGHLFINEFRNRIGRPLSERSLSTIIDKLVEKSGVSFSPHCLRRFYCTTMSDAGLDLDTIRRMMRHSSVETTLRCYLYADPRKMKTAVDSVNGAFSAITC